MKKSVILLVLICLCTISAFAQQQCDTSDRYWRVIIPKASADDIDMKKCLVGSQKDSVITPFINNVGSCKFRVDSIYFKGSDASAFRLVSYLPKYEVTPNSFHNAEFRFIPSRVGIHTAQIVIITQSDTLIKNIRGEGVILGLQTYNKIIDFGVVELGSYKDTIDCLTIQNIATNPMNISNTKHNSPNAVDFTTLSGGGNFTIQSGEIRKMNLRFTPSSLGRTCGTLEFHFANTGSPFVILLFGEARQCNGLTASFSSSNEQLFMDTVTYRNMLCKTLTIKNITKNDLMLENAHFLHNIDFSVPQSQFPVLVKSMDSVDINICFSPNSIGAISDTLIYKDLCSDKRIPVLGYGKANDYSGESNCNTIINMKTATGNSVDLYLPSPNPFPESTSLKFFTNGTGAASVDIFNVYGEKISSQNKTINNAGYNEFVITPTNDIPNGTYICVFRFEDNMQTFKITLIR